MGKLTDIEQALNDDLDPSELIQELESKWAKLSSNFNQVLNHLTECNRQVMDASSSCLESLEENLTKTCDDIDTEIRALYHLISRSDELIIGLRVTEDFREEVRALRKSVETLANLYKSRPQSIKPLFR